MENFDFKKYLAEGKLLKEDYKENLGEEYKQFGRSNYEIQIDGDGKKFIIPYGEKIDRKIYMLNDEGEEKSTAEIEAELGLDPEKPSDGKAEIDREIDDLIKYGKFGQTRRQYRNEKD